MKWNRATGLLILGLSVLAFSMNGYAETEHRIGGGVNYWVMLDDLDLNEDFDDSGLSYLFSYQWRPGIISLELDAEFMPDRFGEDAFSPEAYLLIGDGLYAAVGAGIMNVDGEFESEPFYAFKAGVALNLLPGLTFDLSANYRFNDTADLKDEDVDIDTDTIFLGAMVRLKL